MKTLYYDQRVVRSFPLKKAIYTLICKDPFHYLLLFLVFIVLKDIYASKEKNNFIRFETKMSSPLTSHPFSVEAALINSLINSFGILDL